MAGAARARFRSSAAGRCSTICGGHYPHRQASWRCCSAWTLSGHDAALWTCFILSTIAVPTLLPVLAAIVPRRARITARSHLDALGDDLGLALTQTALTVTFLAHQAWSMTDAIGRTLFRLFVSHRHLLEWVTAAHANLSPAASPCWRLSPDGRQCRHRRSVRVRRLAGRQRCVAGRDSLCPALGRGTGDRAMGKPFSSRGRPHSGV